MTFIYIIRVSSQIKNILTNIAISEIENSQQIGN